MGIQAKQDTGIVSKLIKILGALLCLCFDSKSHTALNCSSISNRQRTIRSLLLWVNISIYIYFPEACYKCPLTMRSLTDREREREETFPSLMGVFVNRTRKAETSQMKRCKQSSRFPIIYSKSPV